MSMYQQCTLCEESKAMSSFIESLEVYHIKTSPDLVQDLVGPPGSGGLVERAVRLDLTCDNDAGEAIYH